MPPRKNKRKQTNEKTSINTKKPLKTDLKNEEVASSPIISHATTSEDTSTSAEKDLTSSPKSKKQKLSEEATSSLVDEATSLIAEPTTTSSEILTEEPKSKNSFINKGEGVNIITWNVNGIKAWSKKDGWKNLIDHKPDIICLQEVKCSEKDIPIEIKTTKGYYRYFHLGDKPGYSGTAILSKIKPISVANGMGIKQHDTEGRMITAEYEDFYLVCCYVPNSGRGLVRLNYRAEWDKDCISYLSDKAKLKPTIFCGDLNVAHQEIDLANPNSNRNKTAGFTDTEREGFTAMLKAGFKDSFRELYPEVKSAYTWWSYTNNARARNIGWRIDYFVVSTPFMEKINDVIILSDYMGSDHCPLQLLIKN